MAEKEEGAEAAPVARKKMSGKKLVLFIILPLLLLGGGAAAGYFLLFAHNDKDKPQAAEQAPTNESEDAAAVDEGKPPVYVDMDDMLVNLVSTTNKTNYLKLKLALELTTPEDQEKVKSVMPRIVDQFLVYLRGLRVDDLQGSEGLQRLREELLLRARMAGKPIKIKDVLFKMVQVQ
ncbi:MAG TPA: flagellar basal body-associated FliL family protein [Dongiaceae bacterium]|nr:flagellar basal body-associated FliL family protein [Dongiaceae bacterium]